jgi:hypothetical protein
MALRLSTESEFNMERVHHHIFFRKDLDRWDYPEPILIFLLFVPSRSEIPLTELERLGIWAARRAREEVKKEHKDTQND